METPLSASNVTDWGSLGRSLDNCSVEASDVISVSGEMELIGSCHSYENKAVASDQQKTKVEQVFDGHKFEPSAICISFFKTVLLLKTRIHGKTVGDYSQNILPCTIFCPSIAQLQSYVIRLH